MSTNPTDNIPPALRVEIEAAEAEHALGVQAPPVVPPTAPLEVPPLPDVVPPDVPPVVPPTPTDTLPPVVTPPAIAPDPAAEVTRLNQAQTVLMSKYNAEVPRLQHQLRAANDQVAALQSENAQLKQQSLTPTPAKPAEPEGPVDPQARYGLSEEDMALGPEFLSLAEKVAGKMTADASTKTAALEQELATLRGSVETASTTARTVGEAQLEKDLNALRPDWASVNETEPFKQFCLQVEPMSGKTYDTILQEGVASGDVIRIVNVFDRFGAPQATVAPAAPLVATPVAAQVVPDGAPTPAKAEEGKRIFTVHEYSTLMENANEKGHYSPERVEQINKELNLAAEEGRVRG
jgi:hypothetical protein